MCSSTNGSGKKIGITQSLEVAVVVVVAVEDVAVDGYKVLWFVWMWFQSENVTKFHFCYSSQHFVITAVTSNLISIQQQQHHLLLKHEQM